MSSAIQITDNEIVVSGSHYIKHDGYIHRTGFLKHTIWLFRDLLNTKSIRFVMCDGEPIVYSSFETVINDIQKLYNIPPDRLLIEVFESTPNYQNNLATVIIRPTPFFKSVDEDIPLVDWQLDSNAKLFGGIYGRFTPHRLLMSYFLETQLANSFVIFRPGLDWVLFDLDPVQDYYAKQLAWAQERIRTNETVGNYATTDMGYHAGVENYYEIWGKYKIEVVIETNIFDHGWFTEKTARCLRTGKPFILLGTPGQLKKLQAMGFKTFNPVINESYDNIGDLDSRFNAITKELERINNLPTAELNNLIAEINTIAKYNAENYTSIINNYYQSFYVQS